MKVYRNLVIEATSPDTDIWLTDDQGHFVEKARGVLDTGLLEGDYIVEFGLGTTTFPIRLMADARYSEEQSKKGPSCPRPIPNIEE